MQILHLPYPLKIAQKSSVEKESCVHFYNSVTVAVFTQGISICIAVTILVTAKNSRNLL